MKIRKAQKPLYIESNRSAPTPQSLLSTQSRKLPVINNCFCPYQKPGEIHRAVRTILCHDRAFLFLDRSLCIHVDSLELPPASQLHLPANLRHAVHINIIHLCRTYYLSELKLALSFVQGVEGLTHHLRR